MLGIIPADGDTYVEVLLSVKGCRVEPCRFSMGLFRDMPDEQIEATIVDQLRGHVSARTR